MSCFKVQLKFAYFTLFLCSYLLSAAEIGDEEENNRGGYFDVEFPVAGKCSIKAERTLLPDVLMQTFTLCLWLKPTHFKGDVITYYVGDTPEFKIVMDGQKLQFNLRQKSSVFPVALSRNNWNQICFRVALADQSLDQFLNGKKESKEGNKVEANNKTRQSEIPKTIKASGKLIIGYDLYSRKDSFQGSISNVQLWKRSLTDHEIAEQMTCNAEQGDVIGWSKTYWIFEFGSPRKRQSTITCNSRDD